MKKITVICAIPVLLLAAACGPGQEAGLPEQAEITTADAETGKTPEVLSPEEPGLSAEEAKAGSPAPAAKKEETVNVKTDASGVPKEIKVEARLSGLPDTDYIRDTARLTGIRNREGDEEFAADGSTVYWQNHGTNIVYEGVSTEPLPFGVRISFYLDGKEVAPEEIAGKSGEVKIRFDYENKVVREAEVNGKTVEMHEPVTAVSLVLLPDDVFSDAEVENGRIVNFGGQQMALGMAMPGLADDLALGSLEMTEDIDIPEYVEIRAYAEKFSLDFTATILSPGFLSGEDEENKAGDEDKIFEDVRKLGEASGDLVDGTKELADGAIEFEDGLSAYADGAESLSSGAAELADGASQLAGNSGSLKSGASGLASGLSELKNSLAGIDTASLAAMSQTDLSSLLEQLNAVDLSGLETAVRAALGDEAAGQVASLSAMLDQLKAAITELQPLPQAAGRLAGSLEGLKEGVSALSDGADALNAGIEAYTSGAAGVASGANALAEGAAELASSGTELKEGCGKLQAGILELKDGIVEFDEEGIQELVKMVNKDLKNVVDRFRAVQDADAAYDNFSGLDEGQEGSVRFIFESGEI